MNGDRPGFTLTELMLSMGIMAVLTGAIASAVFLTTRAVPSTESSFDPVAQARDAAEQIAEDLYCAQSFITRSATVVEFTVPDRNGDAAPETIRYAWSGVAGQPLTRVYNGGTATSAADDVREFTLTYDVKATTKDGPPTQNESAEQVLISRDYTGGSLSEVTAKSGRWPGQYFQPTLPGGALSWKITRVRFVVRQKGAALGETLVQIRAHDATGKPTSTVLGQVSVLESSLTGSWGWYECTYTTVSGLSPVTGACLVFRHVSDTDSCELRRESGGVDTPNAFYVSTSDSGSSWTIDTSRDLLFYVYGTVTTSGPPQVITKYYLTGVRVTLRAGADSSARCATSVQVVAAPEVAGP